MLIVTVFVYVPFKFTVTALSVCIVNASLTSLVGLKFITSLAVALSIADFNSEIVLASTVFTSCNDFISLNAVSLPFPPTLVILSKLLELIRDFCEADKFFPTKTTGDWFLAPNTPTASASISWSCLFIPSLVT